MRKTKHQRGLCHMYGCHTIAVVEVIPNDTIDTFSNTSIKTTLTRSPAPNAVSDLYCQEHWETSRDFRLRPLARVYADGDALFTIRAVDTPQKRTLIQAPNYDPHK